MKTVLLVPSVMLARLMFPVWPNADWRYWLAEAAGEFWAQFVLPQLTP